ncbi:MAG: DUF4249 family protein [Rhodothermaceae bacterium]|nr:DUF4249 family protein [Rhodothermaceae bacterium]MYI83760.1 DUF4249 family protein [Rhodothermaceae bacterium]
MRKLILLPTIVLLLGVLSACEDSVSPIIETDRDYTLFGTLDMARDSQFVRVIPIRSSITEAGDVLDVTVQSIELSTQQTFTWRDSIHTFDDGRIGHIFFAPFRIRPSQTYRLEIIPSDSEIITWAETTVPDLPETEVLDPTLERVLTTRLDARQRVLWHGIDRAPFEVEQWYRFLSLSDFTYKDYQLSYAPISRPLAGETDVWEMDKDLIQDRDTLSTKIELGAFYRLAGVALRITVLDENFVPPGGEYDRELLAQPGTLSNVENGFGLLASVGRFSVEWILPDSVARQIGYIPLGNTAIPDPVWAAPPGTYEVAQH